MVNTPPTTAAEIAVLGGGCFWCLDAVYRRLRGVVDVEAGYAGGATPQPTYEAVCTGRTGHAEVVRITFDPQEVSFRELLEVFFTIHDPTTRDRQGNDVGTQYRSLIVAQSDAQRRIAAEVIGALAREDVFGGKAIVTELIAAAPFHPAETHHQDYFAHHDSQPYCTFVVAPKVAKFRQKFADRLKASA
ncbi:MAG: peptide-methionine (S)-S-oxide reductase MsrA [Burkholderiales bacterium]|nr:peptide-methionine (S)-S-oxide reductase MsrA [Burkholderiales bacterium]